jgi:hypothetical protein
MLAQQIATRYVGDAEHVCEEACLRAFACARGTQQQHDVTRLPGHAPL